MLRRSVCVSLAAAAAPSSSSWRLVELTGLLFAEYFDSPRFRADVLDSLDTLIAICATHWRRSPRVWLAQWHNMLAHRMLYRVMECAVTAACVRSHVAFCRDAVAFFYLAPLVQEYRFARCWPTRLLRRAAAVLYPGPLHRLMRFVLERPFTHVDPVAYTRQPTWHRATTIDGASSNSSSSATIATTAAAAAAASASTTRPLPARGATSRDAFARVPHPFREPVRFYARSYDVHLAYAIAVAGFVPDMTRLAMEHVDWLWLLACERHKHTSRWRLAKHYVTLLSGCAVRTAMHYGARVVGASVGRRLSREPTRGAVFWAESLVALAATLPASVLSELAMLRVRALLERVCPSTAADEDEDRREQEAHEQQAANEAAAAGGGGASFWFGTRATHAQQHPQQQQQPYNNNSSDGSSSSHQPMHHPDLARVDYYAVLGVDADAPAEAIKRAYRQRALQCHPDRVGNDTAAKEAARVQMATVNEAYHTLIDADKRAAYDSARAFDGVAATVQRLATLSPALVVLGTAGALVGFWVASGMLVCSRYAAVFRQVTSPGLLAGPP